MRSVTEVVLKGDLPIRQYAYLTGNTNRHPQLSVIVEIYGLLTSTGIFTLLEGAVNSTHPDANDTRKRAIALIDNVLLPARGLPYDILLPQTYRHRTHLSLDERSRGCN